MDKFVMKNCKNFVIDGNSNNSARKRDFIDKVNFALFIVSVKSIN